MHEQHQHTATVKLRLFLLVQQDEGSTPKRNHNRSIWKAFAMDQLVGRRPHPGDSKESGRDVINKRGRLDRVNPHEKWSTRKDHSKRSHHRHAADIALSKVLLGAVWTNESALHIATSQLFDNRATDILSSVVPHKD
jgi:hypothetical protein